MRARPVLLVVAFIGVLAAGGYLAFAPEAVSAAAPPPSPSTPVLTVMAAARPISEGEILRPSDLRALPWTKGPPPAGAATGGSPQAQRLSGSVTRRAFAAGEPVLPSETVAPGDRSFLAAIIRPGHRAVAVGVDAVTSAGGLIWPGDRVDVILTQELKQDGVPLTQSVLGETVLRDVRVLSIDQKLEAAPPPPAKTGAEEVAQAAAAAPHVPATVTIEVTPVDAERVAVAATLGKLHLGLRSVAAAAEIEADVPTWAGVVSPALAMVRTRQMTLSAPTAAPVNPAPAAPAAAPRGVRVFRGSGAAQ